MKLKSATKSARAALVFCSGILMTSCTLRQIPPTEQACTLIGCGASLEVALVGEHVPTVFTVIVQANTGEYVSIRCTEGNAKFEPPEAGRWGPACPAGGVSLQGFSPEHISLTVRWSDGETSQDFEPTYAVAQPNGAGCEPICRTARVEVVIPEFPDYGPESTWLQYEDQAHKFSIRYPAALPLERGIQSEGYGITYIGERIEIRTTWRDPLVCQGDCPLIESTEPVTVAGREAQLAKGYIGSIGGNIPQYFMLYLFRLGRDFISFELYAESRYAEPGDPGVIIPLRQEDIELFERMMQTLEFSE